MPRWVPGHCRRKPVLQSTHGDPLCSMAARKRVPRPMTIANCGPRAKCSETLIKVFLRLPTLRQFIGAPVEQSDLLVHAPLDQWSVRIFGRAWAQALAITQQISGSPSGPADHPADQRISGSPSGPADQPADQRISASPSTPEDHPADQRMSGSPSGSANQQITQRTSGSRGPADQRTASRRAEQPAGGPQKIKGSRWPQVHR